MGSANLVVVCWTMMRHMMEGRYEEAKTVACDLYELLGKQENVSITPSGMKHKLTVDEWLLAVKEGKCSAIKAFKDRTGLGLKESKDAVEAEVPAEAFKHQLLPIYARNALLSVARDLESDQNEYYSQEVLREKMKSCAKEIRNLLA